MIQKFMRKKSDGADEEHRKVTIDDVFAEDEEERKDRK